jgi:hypothetical protein
MAWHDDYIKRFIANPGQNDATGYGVEILYTAAPGFGEAYFQIIGVHHLKGEENRGNHHVYGDVLDENGKRINGARIDLYQTESNKFHGIMIVDKPPNEPGTNAPMFWNDTFTVVVNYDNLQSEKVKGFHTRHGDEGPGNTRGHHSFYFVAQRKRVGSGPPPPDPEPEPPEDWREELTQEQRLLLKNIGEVPKLVKKMEEMLDG